MTKKKKQVSIEYISLFKKSRFGGGVLAKKCVGQKKSPHFQEEYTHVQWIKKVKYFVNENKKIKILRDFVISMLTASKFLIGVLIDECS